MSGYTDTIRRWATDSRRAGPLEKPDGIGEVGLGEEEAGRRLAVRFTLQVVNGAIEAARFEVFGCGFTIAACAAAADLAEGLTLAEAAALSAREIDARLEGLPADRDYCAVLAAEALHAAIESVAKGREPVRAAVNPAGEEHGARIHAGHPVYCSLMATPAPETIAGEDRHLFACLLSVAASDPLDPAAALGLEPWEIDEILATYFPGADSGLLFATGPAFSAPPPERNSDVLDLLLSHVPSEKEGRSPKASRWLARALAARAAHPGHLWVAMGLFERPELTAAIRRHLPSLAEANHQGMRWKRYLFREICRMGGGVVCKAPDCGECSDYPLCFDTGE